MLATMEYDFDRTTIFSREKIQLCSIEGFGNRIKVIRDVSLPWYTIENACVTFTVWGAYVTGFIKENDKYVKVNLMSHDGEQNE